MGMIYQQTRLSDHSAVGAPGPLPYCVENWHDAELADLDAMKLDPQFGLAGMGFWPVVVTAPSYDPTNQVLVPPTTCDKADPVAKCWTATATVRAMTAAEFAVANPPKPVSGDAIIGVIAKADRAKADMTDLARIAYRDDVPATNAKLGRIAAALGTTAEALRQAAASA